MHNFEPQNAVDDVEDWKLLFQHFGQVHFGHSFWVALPHYGNLWARQAESLSESESDDYEIKEE